MIWLPVEMSQGQFAEEPIARKKKDRSENVDQVQFIPNKHRVSATT